MMKRAIIDDDEAKGNERFHVSIRMQHLLGDNVSTDREKESITLEKINFYLNVISRLKKKYCKILVVDSCRITYAGQQCITIRFCSGSRQTTRSHGRPELDRIARLSSKRPTYLFFIFPFSFHSRLNGNVAR